MNKHVIIGLKILALTVGMVLCYVAFAALLNVLVVACYGEEFNSAFGTIVLDCVVAIVFIATWAMSIDGWDKELSGDEPRVPETHG